MEAHDVYMSEPTDKHLERAKLVAGHLNLSDGLIPHVHEHLSELMAGKAPVIWIQGQNCTGCSVTVLNSDHFSPIDLDHSKLSLQYQPNVMSASGFQAINIIEEVEKELPGKYLVVLKAQSRRGTERRSAPSDSRTTPNS